MDSKSTHLERSTPPTADVSPPSTETNRPFSRYAVGEWPVSRNQEQLWLFQQWNPRSSVYNIPAAFSIEGELDVERLKRCLAETIRRHSMLRSVFRFRNGKLVRSELPPTNMHFETRNPPEQDSGVTIAELLTRETTLPFVLASGPLWRPVLWKVGQRNHILQLTIHHIIADGWSINVLLRELASLYRAESDGVAPRLPVLLPIVNDGGKCRPENSDFWARELAGATDVVDLPLDRPRGLRRSYLGRRVNIAVDSAATNTLRELARSENASLFVALAAAFNVLLYRYGGQTDSVTAFVDSQRSAETADRIGYFANLLPLRTRLDPTGSFRSLLRQTRDVLHAAREHGQISLSEIVEATMRSKTPNFLPFAQVVFTQAVAAADPITAGNVSLRPLQVDPERAKFDLTLHIGESHGGVLLSIEYSSDVFDKETVDRMGTNFGVLLSDVAQQPDDPIESRSILSAAEAELLLIGFNATSRPIKPADTIPILLELQVERTPNRRALSMAGGETLTYYELNRQANRLASRLRGLGVGRDCRVGLLMERSVSMVVGLLGILKSGSAYVPLDMDNPLSRIRFMAEDSEISQIVTLSDHLETAQALGVPCLTLDSAPNMDNASDQNPAPVLSGIDCAYIIYTSGSTGTPKGVANHHRGICNRLLWMQDQFHLSEDDRVLQKTPSGFDVSILELLWPLLVGAELVLCPPGTHRDNQALRDIIALNRITTIHFVPSMLRAFLDVEAIERCRDTLRHVLCSGEALTGELQRLFFERMNLPLHNFYGPTEAAVDVTYWRCEQDVPRDFVPIGKPIANTRIYILDRLQQLLPIGAQGEIYIGGANVALGYWNRPDLTASAFFDDWFVSDPGARLFKTGDRGRFLASGAIEFLGRLDRQVKVRGYRVELGEIEARMLQHPDIAAGAVIQTRRGLIGYVVVRRALRVSEIRNYLRLQVPDYMVPVEYVVMEALPLTSSGKINYVALPEPRTDRPRLETEFREPASDTGRKLATVWSTVLQKSPIGADDNFFDLGGDSLRSLEVVSRARSVGVFLSLEDLIRYPTVEELSQFIDQMNLGPIREEAKDATDCMVLDDLESLPTTIEDAYPLSMLQQGLVFHSSVSSEYAAYVTSYRIRASFSRPLLVHAITRAIIRHPMLRSSFDLRAFDCPYQLVHRTAPVPLFVEDWRQREPSQVHEHLKIWLQERRMERFVWDKVPLFRIYAHLITNQEFQLTMVEPFLDGWSVAQLTSEILADYANDCEVHTMDVTPLTTSYREYVALERMALRSDRAKSFWNKMLTERERTFLAPALFLPGEGRPRAFRRQIELPIEIQVRITEIARQLSVPLKSVLLAVHLRVLGVLTGKAAVMTGLMSNGRPETSDGERTIGLFLNVVPLTVDLSDGNWANLIGAAAKTEANLLQFRRYPLAQMQLDHGGPLFDTVFNFVHFRTHEALPTDKIKILDRVANDQTYFFLTIQFAVDWRTSQLGLTLDFNIDERCASTMDLVERRYTLALAQLADDCEQDYLVQPLLTPTEESQLLYEWNATDAELPSTGFVRLFEQRVTLRPDAIACGGEKPLSYASLNARANSVAQRLRARGVGREVVVAVIAQRNPAFLVITLAILKAGGVYLPITPDWPLTRMCEVLVASGARVAMVDAASLKLLKSIAPGNMSAPDCEFVEIEAGLWKDATDANFPSSPAPTDLAYLIYTSGTEGRPKGVMIEQAGMLNHLCAKIEDLHLSDECVVAQTALQSFDISVWQLLAALLVGGRVEICADEIARDPLRLARLIRDRGVTVVQTVPGFLRALIRCIAEKRIPSESFANLRFMVVTGEAVPPDTCRQWFEYLPRVPLVNAYGPTECSDDVTHHIMTVAPIETTSVPIGRAIRNTKLYILNKRLVPVPPGVSGELFVGGTGVGRGYLGDSVETDRCFFSIALTPGTEPVRLYRTGDLARYRPDGTVEFLGRADRQLKIRGFRLEPGEIEDALRQQPGVRDAVVVKKVRAEGEALLAYLVCAPGEQISHKQIRDQLRQRLPVYAVPTEFVTLPKLVYNERGKLDLAALPEPRGAETLARASIVSPRNALEAALVATWENFFPGHAIGITDNFFDLGGHSLLAIALAGKISDQVGREVPVHVLLRYPSISELIQEIEKSKSYQSHGHRAGLNKTRSTRFGTLESPEQLLEHTASAVMARLDSAALGYLPLSAAGAKAVLKGKPFLRRIFTTRIGRIGHITMPVLSSDLHADPEGLFSAVAEALTLAHSLGANSVSLTGLIPSATAYGRDVSARLAGRSNVPMITTGHGTTVSAVVMAIERILAESGRDLRLERVGFLGLGSIGAASVGAMLKLLPHPKEIALCDLYAKYEKLRDAERLIRDAGGYVGNITLHAAKGKVPDAFLTSTLIVAATSSGEVLDVSEIHPGTLLVDDSAPHCFSEGAAVRRLLKQQDILFTEGGILRSGSTISEIRFLPEGTRSIFSAVSNYRASDRDIMGCILASAVPLAVPMLAPELGPASVESVVAHYAYLKTAGYSAPSLCCGDYELPISLIRKFRTRFASSPNP